MPETETYDVWVITDADGPVLYFPVPSGSPAPPADHVARHRQQAALASAPDGLIEGVWARTRARLGDRSARLVAEIADPEVEVRRAARRAATMARGADAAAWAPEELLAEPEPAPKPARRPTTPRTPRTGSTRPAAPRKRTTAPKPVPAPKPSEPEEKVCPRCFMVRRLDQFTDEGTCEFCAS